MSVHFSSKTELWATPLDFFKQWESLIGGFDIDVCATKDNTKCKKFFSKEDDGLSKDWTGKCWMNPPYGKEIGKWMKKAYESSKNGACVVCLVPSRTDTRWWHDYAMKGKITFIKGRLKFGDSKNSAPFPSAIVIFGEVNV
jgi:phage N-6-adenine-methyltransferase